MITNKPVECNLINGQVSLDLEDAIEKTSFTSAHYPMS